MDLFILEVGYKERDLALDSNNGLMDLFMKDNGTKIKQMAKDV